MLLSALANIPSIFLPFRPAAAAAASLQSCPILCDPIDGISPGFPVPGILQARTLEWVAIFLLQHIKVKSKSEVTQSWRTLIEPMDCSPPGSSIHGIFQESLFITHSPSLLKLMAIKLVMLSNHLMLCHSLLLLSIFPYIRVFSNESVLHIMCPKYWSIDWIISSMKFDL